MEGKMRAGKGWGVPLSVGAAPLDDGALLLAIANRDHQAFATLYGRYERFAFRIAYQVLKEQGQAEDAVQEGFLRIWRSAASFDPQRGGAQSWVGTVIQHGAINRLRGKAGRTRTELPLELTYALVADAAPEAVIEASERRETVIRVLATLPRSQREVVELAYFAELTCREIAEQTATAPGTVKSRLRLGLQKLREALAPAALLAS